jgi:hypothetical protein
MVQLMLKNHQVWQELTEIFKDLNPDTLIQDHLNECGYKIHGYWDNNDQFYDEIALPHTLTSELVSHSIGIANQGRFLQLRFTLKVPELDEVNSDKNYQSIGELVLIYDEAMEFLDENWLLDLSSSCLEFSLSE